MAAKKGAKKPRLVVVEESKTGMNERFLDTKTNKTHSREVIIKKIEKGHYDDYHIVTRTDGTKYPRSNPDGKNNNNLG